MSFSSSFSSSSNSYDYLLATGLIVPNGGAVLSAVQAEWQGAFGSGLNTDATTPQGVIIAGDTVARSGTVANNAQVANQINPNQAGGVFLDALGGLLGIPRAGNMPTFVSGVTLGGEPSAFISAGCYAANSGGFTFALISGVTLNVSGNAYGVFSSLDVGPTPCASGALTSIITDALGWETVSNGGSATTILGSLAQNDQQYRYIRNNTLANNAKSVISGAYSDLYEIPSISAVVSLANYNNTSQTISGIVMSANGVWYCVDGGPLVGGNYPQIASALLLNKGMGGPWVGNQSSTISDPVSNQAVTVKFDIIDVIQLLCQITVRQGTFTGNITSSVVAAVLAFSANTIENIQGCQMGVNVSPFDIAGGVQVMCPGIQVKLCQISLTSPVSYVSTEIAMAIYEKGQFQYTNIDVIITT